MAQIKAILFDLGGVLVDFVGLNEVQKLLPEAVDPVKMRSKWIGSPSISAFERGDITSEEFSSQFVEEWELQIPPDLFLGVFASWIRGPFTGTEKLLKELYPHYTLACLSNTNEVHWGSLLSECGLDSLLHRQYASHLIGEVKPKPKAFEYACQDLGLAAEEIVFFDDGEENIIGAKQFGLHAYRVTSPEEILTKLGELGLLGEVKT